MTNKKMYFSIGIIILIIVIIAIYIRKNKNIENANQINNTVTTQEVNEKIIYNIKQKLEENGLRLQQEKKEILTLTKTEGYSYVINTQNSDMKLFYEDATYENNRIHIYKINLREKRLLFDSNVNDGKILLDVNGTEYKGVLYNNILVLNCTDKQIEDIIVKTIKNL